MDLYPLTRTASQSNLSPQAGRGKQAAKADEIIAVITCDKREAFAQGSASDEAIHTCFAARLIASLRSQ
jgi:hypothetical protein